MRRRSFIATAFAAVAGLCCGLPAIRKRESKLWEARLETMSRSTSLTDERGNPASAKDVRIGDRIKPVYYSLGCLRVEGETMRVLNVVADLYMGRRLAILRDSRFPEAPDIMLELPEAAIGSRA